MLDPRKLKKLHGKARQEIECDLADFKQRWYAENPWEEMEEHLAQLYADFYIEQLALLKEEIWAQRGKARVKR